MYNFFRYIVSRILIAIVCTALIYLFYPLIIQKQQLSHLNEVFLICCMCSFFIHLIYRLIVRLVLSRKKISIVAEALICFLIAPLFWVIIGLSTFGVDYKGLLVTALAIGLPNSFVPYLENKRSSISA
jgi:uncharacterized protein with PQ loop repeat